MNVLDTAEVPLMGLVLVKTCTEHAESEYTVKVTEPVGFWAPRKVAVSEVEPPTIIELPDELASNASAMDTHPELPLQLNPTPRLVCVVVTCSYSSAVLALP